MTDSYGSTQLPLVVPSAGQANGDPLLTYVLAYFQTIANAYALTAWQALRPGTKPIQTAIAFDPTRKRSFYFDDAWLPALFMWRMPVSKRLQIGQDLRVKYGHCGLLWVPPISEANRPDLAARGPFGNGLFDLLDTYFERGQDPAWQLAGDTYPTIQHVQTYGSSLLYYAGFRRMYFEKTEPIEIDIARTDESARTYDAWMSTMAIEEPLTRGTLFSPLTGLDQQIKATDQGFGDGGFIVAEGIEPVTSPDTPPPTG